MSRKHNQRTRAEILAKRNQPVEEIPVRKKIIAPNGQWLYVPQPTHSERLRTAFDASMSRPRTGAKEQERAKRLYESQLLNEQFVDHYARIGVILSEDQMHDRATPTLCQFSKKTHNAYLEAREQEYESAF